MKGKSRTSLKDLNRQKVYQYIYQTTKENTARSGETGDLGRSDDFSEELPGASRQQVTYDLRLSLQTVTQCLNDLLASGKILQAEETASTGGRPAAQYLFHKEMRLAIGVEIRTGHFTAAAINLLGEIQKKQDFKVPFENKQSYYQAFCEHVQSFIQELAAPSEHLLGVAISLQAMINDETGNISHAMLLQNGSFPMDYVQSQLPLPVRLFHDAEAAGMAEAFYRQETDPSLYLMLNENLGSAFLLNGEVLHSPHLSSGTIEHMKLYHTGRKCYCGKCGCAEAYCSANSLQDISGMKPTDFFTALHAGDEQASIIWTKYLTDLAFLIDNSRMVIPCNIILGGVVESHMQESDLAYLKEKISELSTYSDIPVTISRSKVRQDAVLQGVSMHMILEFLAQEGLQ